MTPLLSIYSYFSNVVLLINYFEMLYCRILVTILIPFAHRNLESANLGKFQGILIVDLYIYNLNIDYSYILAKNEIVQILNKHFQVFVSKMKILAAHLVHFLHFRLPIPSSWISTVKYLLKS